MLLKYNLFTVMQNRKNTGQAKNKIDVLASCKKFHC